MFIIFLPTFYTQNLIKVIKTYICLIDKSNGGAVLKQQTQYLLQCYHIHPSNHTYRHEDIISLLGIFWYIPVLLGTTDNELEFIISCYLTTKVS